MCGLACVVCDVWSVRACAENRNVLASPVYGMLRYLIVLCLLNLNFV